MKIKKAVITCAGPNQRKLPLQTLIDRDGIEKSVLEVLVEEILATGIDKIGCVVFPEDKKAYSEIVGDYKRHIEFIIFRYPLTRITGFNLRRYYLITIFNYFVY